MRKLTLVTLSLLALNMMAQQNQNTADKMLSNDSKLTIGGYGEIEYQQALNSEIRSNASLDVQRMIIMFGYKFNEKTSFITELEFEHVKEVYVEQAFMNYEISPEINFRAGLMLVPMGIINEYHEPYTYNGVTRPLIDNKIAPTTWREIGAGFTGVINNSFKYQIYLMNGFNGYDGSAKLSGSKGFRSGRQKGAESYMSSPNLAAKINYQAIPGLDVGIAGYVGNTQSVLYDGIDKNNDIAIATADSSSVGMAMTGIDLRYIKSGWELRSQFYYMNVSNTKEYNQFTGSDLGSALMGYYAELGYNIFNTSTNITTEFVPFVRYETYNTHQKTDGIAANDANNNQALAVGFGWRPAFGAVFKADVQFTKNKTQNEFSKLLNLGVGVWF